MVNRQDWIYCEDCGQKLVEKIFRWRDDFDPMTGEPRKWIRRVKQCPTNIRPLDTHTTIEFGFEVQNKS